MVLLCGNKGGSEEGKDDTEPQGFLPTKHEAREEWCHQGTKVQKPQRFEEAMVSEWHSLVYAGSETRREHPRLAKSPPRLARDAG